MSDVAGMHCLVAGRVQGVGYRAFVLDAAQALSLVGWVRNLPDGRVELVAGGRREALAELERRLRDGPPLAAVRAVTRVDCPAPDGAGFRIG